MSDGVWGGNPWGCWVNILSPARAPGDHHCHISKAVILLSPSTLAQQKSLEGRQE